MALAAGLAIVGAPTAEVLPPLQVYFGDLAAAAPVELAASARSRYLWAREEAAMDFLALVAPESSDSLSQTAASITARNAGEFVALDAWLFGPREIGQPVVVLGGQRMRDPALVPRGRFDLFYRFWLPDYADRPPDAPVLHLPAPARVRADYGAPSLGSLEALREAAAPYARTMQIAGPMSLDGSSSNGEVVDGWAAYLGYLDAGFRLAPAAGWGQTPAATRASHYRTAVLAPALTAGELLNGVRQRRVYATQDRNLRAFFSINGRPMGSVVPVTPGMPLRIEVTLSDLDEPEAQYWVSLRRDVPGGRVDAMEELFGTDYIGDGRVVLAQLRRSRSTEYFLVQVTQRSAEGTDVLWTAPIWLVSPGDQASGTLP